MHSHVGIQSITTVKEKEALDVQICSHNKAKQVMITSGIRYLQEAILVIMTNQILHVLGVFLEINNVAKQGPGLITTCLRIED